ncbi:TIGR03084 family metal-binding protein [Parasphingorhabdus sp. JC815]|uniref:TIGR03084 family metal-binding protein n=1 Tax=Parasphingorhabdus sp. JC815 TaxID=3232140 RepID=UPI0034597215
MEQAQDFLDESEAIYELVKDLSDEQMEQVTGFKGWSINAIIRHLHIWNMAAYWSLTDPEKFHAFFKEMMTGMKEKAKKGEKSLRFFEADYLDNLSGTPLVETWRNFYQKMTPEFAAADPAMRVEWAGPSMSARSSITARLMENWSHAQAIYDVLGVKRENQDRIRNIVMIGLNTYGWTFKVNREEAPQPVPYLKLTAPSGAIWEYGDKNTEEKIEGLAEEFCQVVTQTRNIADTDLEVSGPNATRWMAIAQCFAGAAEKPPAPGTRVMRAA